MRKFYIGNVTLETNYEGNQATCNTEEDKQ